MIITPSRAKLLLLVLLVPFTSTLMPSPSPSEASLLTPIAHLCIVNDLRPGMNLSAHCKSKDSDLGLKVVPFGGNFSFHFRPGFWGTTLFFCRMEWKYSTAKYFDIYSGERDRLKCKCYHYTWKIRPEGPCMFHRKTGLFDFCYEWNKP